ncbi:MAG: hypothetical protein U0903_08310 [Planctomycetales bacterium]
MRFTSRRIWLSGILFSFAAFFANAEEQILFEDNFNQKLSDKWQVVGLKPEDYRVRNGALELRVQPGAEKKDTPMLKVILPFDSDGVTASVEISVVDEFTSEAEFAGMGLVDESGPEFTVRKARIDKRLLFKPGEYEFQGKPGEEGDVDKYSVRYFPATKDAGALRILVNHEMAFFQVGPSAEKRYLNLFHSAIRNNCRERGFFAQHAAGSSW